jgi:hypothetical protein
MVVEWRLNIKQASEVAIVAAEASCMAVLPMQAV